MKTKTIEREPEKIKNLCNSEQVLHPWPNQTLLWKIMFASTKFLKIINWSLKKKMTTKLSTRFVNESLQNLKRDLHIPKPYKNPVYRLGLIGHTPKSNRIWLVQLRARIWHQWPTSLDTAIGAGHCWPTNGNGAIDGAIFGHRWPFKKSSQKQHWTSCA